MRARDVRCLLVSDFNTSNLAGFLRNEPDAPRLDVVQAPFGQVASVLIDAQSAAWLPQPDVAVVWTRPEAVVEHFGAALAYEAVPADRLLEGVDSFCATLTGARGRAGTVLVPAWVVPPDHRGWGMLDWKNNLGIARAVTQMNLRLAERLEQERGFYVLDAQRWMAAAGPRAFSPRLWHMGKLAFGNEVFEAAARDIKAAIRGLMGLAKKLIVLDLDDVLWGGIVGEIGWQQVRLGGHDPVGEAFVDFQGVLRSLKRRGVLLAIASKNDEAVALDAIEHHPEMVLRRDDFTAWRINWRDKAQNLAELAAELQIGLDAVVFIDDSAAERSRVREALPDVFVPDWPEDPMLYSGALSSLTSFDAPALSQEDVERGSMYAAGRARETALREVGAIDAWLESLELSVHVEPLGDANLPRAAQLLNKTNQMNLRTRRLTDAAFANWAAGPHCGAWTLRVRDRFGDYGLVGLISAEWQDDVFRIVDFVLSCRVLGRRVENAMVAVAVECARALTPARELRAEYLPTSRNDACLQFLVGSGLTRHGDTWVWPADSEYARPSGVHIVGAASAAEPRMSKRVAQ